MTNHYELTCLISSNLEELEKQRTVEEIKELIGQGIKSTSSLREVKLGYPINDEEKASMVIFNFDSEAIETLQQALKENKAILRHFLVKKKETVRIPEPITKTETSKKVELKDIDQKIEEILNPSEQKSDENNESE